MDKQKILENVEKLYNMWKRGELGGEFMPEDSKPYFKKYSLENYFIFYFADGFELSKKFI